MTNTEFREAMYALYEEYQHLNTELTPVSHDFWYVADRLPTNRLLSELKYLSNTNLMRHNGTDWHQLNAILNDYSRYKWTKKQKYWCICQLVQYWDRICARRGV